MSKICTIYPDRITVRNSHNLPSYWDYWDKKIKKANQKINENSLKNLKVKKKSINLSKASKRKIKDSFSLLYHLAKCRTIKISNKKYIYNFRLSFVTLTLPSKQIHTDVEIKKVCLNNFLNSMRNKFGLKNYIWISEIQENGNLHFHCVFDTYIHHKAIRYYWNRSIELLGYVSQYSNRMQKLSLKDYAELRGKNISEVASYFYEQNKEGWSNPPTEQVKAIRNVQNLVFYLSKYITKENDNEEKQEYEDRAETWGKSWGRSSSLSRIRFITMFDFDSILYAIERLGNSRDYLQKRTFDYCEVIYFNLKKAPDKFLRWIRKKMVDLGKTYDFAPS